VPSVVWWYRTSPRPLATIARNSRPTTSDPPLSVSGMTYTLLDTRGRLVEFHAMPPQRDESNGVDITADWASLFELAELPRERFTPAAPEWTPRGYADVRAAWTGDAPDLPGVPLRVEAAAYRGRPVYFVVVGPWSRASRMEQAQAGATARFLAMAGALIGVALLAGAALAARHNVKQGRVDRSGAARLAGALLAVLVAGWALSARHYPDLQVESDHFLFHTALALLTTGTVWLFYLALEPAVRRFWPDALVGWTRLLSGRWRDPRVGRDILIGAAAGSVMAVLGTLSWLTPSLLGAPPLAPVAVSLSGLASTRYLLRDVLVPVQWAVSSALAGTLAFALLRKAVRRDVIAAVIVVVVFTVVAGREIVSESHVFIGIAFAALIVTFVMSVLWRFGLLATVAMFYVNSLLQRVPATADFSQWYAPTALVPLTIAAALAGYGFYCARFPRGGATVASLR
jgi:serine/threonine-protein kinase